MNLSCIVPVDICTVDVHITDGTLRNFTVSRGRDAGAFGANSVRFNLVFAVQQNTRKCYWIVYTTFTAIINQSTALMTGNISLQHFDVQFIISALFTPLSEVFSRHNYYKFWKDTKPHRYFILEGHLQDYHCNPAWLNIVFKKFLLILNDQE